MSAATIDAARELRLAHGMPTSVLPAAPPDDEHGRPLPRPTLLGLGALGRSLATAALVAGHRPTVWNRTAHKADPLVLEGARPAAAIDAAVEAGDVIVVCLPAYADVTAVLEPVADSLAGRTIVNLSSGTPDGARSMARWLDALGADYLDGAAMSGTRLVGDPTALFLYSGLSTTFGSACPLLEWFGRAVHVGADPGAAALHDTALLTVNLGLLGGFYHAAAMMRAGGIDVPTFATLTADYLPFAVGLVGTHARDAADGEYPGDDGTLDVYAAAVDHVVTTSEQLGLSTDVPTGLRRLITRAVLAGHGADGLARLIDTVGSPAPDEDRQAAILY